MKQLREASLLECGLVRLAGPEQADIPVLHGARHVVIACDTAQHDDSAIGEEHSGLVRKLTDAFFYFIGYHRRSEPFRNRQWD
jgi:hypothetical protein